MADRPSVMQAHELISTTWPGKLVVPVDAASNCFLEAYLVAINHQFINVEDDLQSLRLSLSDYILQHPAAFAACADLYGYSNDSAQMHSNKLRSNSFFELIHVYMFEQMTGRQIDLYCMDKLRAKKGRPPPPPLLQKYDVDHGSTTKSNEGIIQMCFHSSYKLFAPIIVIDHPHASYNYKQQRLRSS